MTAMLDISPDQRKLLLELLGQHIPAVEVWAYGSRVIGTARPLSDLDLVAFTAPEQAAAISELKDALEESDLPFVVDLHVWGDMPERFRDIIRKACVVIQEREATEISDSEGLNA